jgi:Putative peptidoglycan binding domain
MSLSWMRGAFTAVLLLSCALIANIFLFQPADRGQTTASPGGGVARDDVRSAVAGGGSGWSLELGSRAAEQLAVRPAANIAEMTRAIQRELQAKGYNPGAVDGIPGQVTRASIMAYESDRGLALTAEPSEGLLQDILLGSAGLSPPDQRHGGEPGPNAQLITRSVQQSLLQLGFTLGAVDGRLNDGTVAAIRKFEASQGLKESGRISGPLVSRLARLAGQKLSGYAP